MNRVFGFYGGKPPGSNGVKFIGFPLLLAALFETAAPAAADGITISCAYARSSGPNARAGAAFMTIENTDTAADRLISVESDIAVRTELHTHIETDDGIVQMRPAGDGFAIPARGARDLERGGDHIMFMGLTGELKDGEAVAVTLTFERAGEIAVAIPVDQRRETPGDGRPCRP